MAKGCCPHHTKFASESVLNGKPPVESSRGNIDLRKILTASTSSLVELSKQHPTFLREYKLVVCGWGPTRQASLIVQVRHLISYKSVTHRRQFIQSYFIGVWDPKIEDSYRKQCVIDGDCIIFDVLDTVALDHEEYDVMRDQYYCTGKASC